MLPAWSARAPGAHAAHSPCTASTSSASWFRRGPEAGSSSLPARKRSAEYLSAPSAPAARPLRLGEATGQEARCSAAPCLHFQARRKLPAFPRPRVPPSHRPAKAASVWGGGKRRHSGPPADLGGNRGLSKHDSGPSRPRGGPLGRTAAEGSSERSRWPARETAARPTRADYLGPHR